ncbi:MAG TPA: DUF5703 domain-containing protein [Bacteroidota bacterium]|nr:DUF5703 domain-containing protein [Bacteroidota bacterium]
MKAMMHIASLLLLIGMLDAQDRSQPLIDVNYQKLVSRGDLTYDAPASRREEGLPIGNGRMGSLVWTSPSAIKFQINRVDVFSSDASSVSFPRADSDYGSSCGYLDVNLVDAGEDVFAGKGFRQHLSLYDGLVTVAGKGVTAKVFALHGRDVIAVEVTDNRTQPSAINIDLRMLRYAVECIYEKSYELAKNHEVVIRTAEHTATSQLHVIDKRILLTQEYREREYYNATAVAIEVIGKKSRSRFLNESTVQLSVAPGKGTCTILIAGASNFDPKLNVANEAMKELDAVDGKSFSTLHAVNAEWWKSFWSKGFVHMSCKDGQADFVEQNYTYFLYLMGSISLGDYPPRFAGLLFNTDGDMRRWGSQYWWANTSAYYRNLLASNRPELTEPLFSMYSGMYQSCETAARQQWGSKGIWIPEIVTFKGVEELPEDIASELQDLMLVRKPYEQRSAKFQWFVETKNRHHARWNFLTDGHWEQGHFVVPTKASFQPQRFSSPEAINGIFGHCTHILSVAARVAQVYWQKYEYTRDKAWLKDRAYPMIKGAAEFYRNFPNLKKEADGKYHIHHVNNGESDWNSSDAPNEVNAMRMIFPLAMHAAEILGVDSDLRPLWREISENLVQLPERPRRGGGNRGGYGAFVYGGPGAIEPLGSEPELKSMFLNFNRTGGFIDTLGIGGGQIFRNRLRLREGPGAIDAEHIGGLTSGIHTSLLRAGGGSIDGEQIIQVFASWPQEWDAVFSLLAPGGFLVSSSQRKGAIEFVELQSQLGGDCRLQNPWNDSEVSLFRNGNKAEALRDSLLEFPTAKGETVVVVRAGTRPSDFQTAVLK